jgi:hypothetical protein
MKEVNKNTELDNTDKKLHISGVRRSFSFTYDDLKQAFEDGGWVTSWSDMGIEMKYDNFEEWFEEWVKKNYV